jgi:hypothetical protein
MNFSIQGHAAEMLRWACSLAVDRGLQVDAPNHDALLLEGAADDTEDVIFEGRRAMGDATSIILGGPRLDVDMKVIQWPDRFQDADGWETWCRIMAMIESLSQVG